MMQRLTQITFAQGLAGLLLAALVAGCGSQPPAPDDSSGPLAAQYLTTTEPAGAKGVGELRQASEIDERVTVVGRIGGSPDPFVDGLAAFEIVDPQLAPCPPDEGCPTPWDYCCDLGELAANKAIVQVVDDQGRVLRGDARKLFGLRELATVVVEGRAKRDPQGNLTVEAEQIYVKQQNDQAVQ